MDTWTNLLFGNAIGIAAVLTVTATTLIVSYIIYLFISKSAPKK